MKMTPIHSKQDSKKGKVIYIVIFVALLVTTASVRRSLFSHNTKANVNVVKANSNHHFLADQTMRLCKQNPYAPALKLPLTEYGEMMDNWIDNKIAIEKDLVYRTLDDAWDHTRFEAFEVMGGCKEDKVDCIGGKCKEDESKIMCGATTALEAPCVVYSIGSNNQWEFEMDILAKTPCEVHTFDCTGDRERFAVPDDPRHNFHYVCLGTKNKETEDGEFWTLDKMTKTLKHKKIDLLKMDIEGYEFPLLQDWPENTEKRYDSTVLPMQVLVEVHYKTQMAELSKEQNTKPLPNWKYTTDMINMQEHLLKMGYATIIRDDNEVCPHCSELTLMRIRCPE